MRFLVIADLVAGRDVHPYLEAEGRAVESLLAAGTLEEVYGKVDGSGAVLIVQEESEEAARAKLEALPLVEAELLELGPFVQIATREELRPVTAAE